jgi:hypothetical protein
MQRQKPVTGGRKRVQASADRELERLVRQDARRYGVSRSWVIVTALAAVYGVKVDQFTRPRNVLRIVQGGKGRRRA